MAATTLGGATFGAFASSLVGTSVSSSQLREYEDAIAGGEILLIVESDETRSAQLRELVLSVQPTIRYAGEKPPPPVL